MSKPQIVRTVNPDGTCIEHLFGYDPAGKAVFSEGMYIHKAGNAKREVRNQFKSKLKVA